MSVHSLTNVSGHPHVVANTLFRRTLLNDSAVSDVSTWSSGKLSESMAELRSLVLGLSLGSDSDAGAGTASISGSSTMNDSSDASGASGGSSAHATNSINAMVDQLRPVIRAVAREYVKDAIRESLEAAPPHVRPPFNQDQDESLNQDQDEPLKQDDASAACEMQSIARALESLQARVAALPAVDDETHYSESSDRALWSARHTALHVEQQLRTKADVRDVVLRRDIGIREGVVPLNARGKISTRYLPEAALAPCAPPAQPLMQQLPGSDGGGGAHGATVNVANLQLTTDQVEPTEGRRYWDPALCIDSDTNTRPATSTARTWSAARIDSTKADWFPEDECFLFVDDFVGSDLSDFWVASFDEHGSNIDIIDGVGGIASLRAAAVTGAYSSISSTSRSIGMNYGCRLKWRAKLTATEHCVTRIGARYEPPRHARKGDEPQSIEFVFDSRLHSGRWVCKNAASYADKLETLTHVAADTQWHTFSVGTRANSEIHFGIDGKTVAVHRRALPFELLSVFMSQSSLSSERATELHVDAVKLVGDRSGIQNGAGGVRPLTTGTTSTGTATTGTGDTATCTVM